METSPHVPSPVRRRFVIVSCVLWMIPLVMVVIRAERDWPEWRGFWPTIMGIILLILWVAEKCVRRAYLPRPGRAAWCFRVSLLVGAMAVSGMWLETKFGKEVPGLYRRTEDGPIQSSNYPGPPDPNFKAGFVDQARTERHPAFGIHYQSEKLRIHPDGKPEAPGWVIHRGETSLRSEQGGELIPWNGEGVVDIIERMSGPIRSPGERLMTTQSWDFLCKVWSAGAFISNFNGQRPLICCGEVSLEAGYPVKWLQITMIGFPVMLLMFAIPITARETMG